MTYFLSENVLEDLAVALLEALGGNWRGMVCEARLGVVDEEGVGEGLVADVARHCDGSCVLKSR